MRITGQHRYALYKQTIIESWAAALCIGTLALFSGFNCASLGIQGLALDRFQVPIVATAVLALVGVGIFVLMVYQSVAYALNADKRQQAWRQLTQHSGSIGVPDDFQVELLVPRSKKERRLFALVALTAGICEEFLMRGILFAVVMNLFPGLSAYAVPVICALLFGVAHAYQGIKGIVQTSVVGLFLGLLYLATGSLIPGMILHFAIDLSSCFIAPDSNFSC
jgi:membrane protease YdiL (CAAX protease family)